MPDEKEKSVPIDTSGPDATVDIEEKKDEDTSAQSTRGSMPKGWKPE